MDYSATELKGFVPAKMPTKYIIEMFMDRVAACKTYNGKKYTDADPYRYYMKGKEHIIMEEESKALLEKLLTMLKDQGEQETDRYIRTQILGKKK